MNLQNNLQTVNPCADCYPCTNKCGMLYSQELMETIDHLSTNNDGLYSLSEVQEEVKHNKWILNNTVLSTDQENQVMTRLSRLKSLNTYIKS